jgi:hypothetical protein
MAYARAIDVPLVMQWDPDSRLPLPDPGTAPGNCGMAAVVQVAWYYRDYRYGIYATRRLVTTSLKLSTTVTEQRDALRKRGVPCRLARPTIAQLHAMLATGRRPVIIGMDMGLVPDSIAGHDFQDDHGVTLRANASGGFSLADPNFSTRTNRLDPTRGRRFYPDWVVKRAYWDAGKWAIVPDADKVVVGPAPTPTPTPTTGYIADGDPYPMRFRSRLAPDGAAPSYRLRAGKPIRKGALTSSGLWATVPTETRIFAVGYIPKADLPAAEQVYGDVLIVPWYQTNGDHFGYVKAIDLA